MKSYFLLVFCALCCFSNVCGRTLITAQDKDYSGIALRCYAYDNLLTKSPLLLDEATVSSDGKLELNLNITESQLVFIPFYSFRMTLYAEPNQELEIKLPKLSKLESVFLQMKSYTEREIPLFVNDKSSLNQCIGDFDAAYNAILRKHVNELYSLKNKEMVAAKISGISVNCENKYFKEYKKNKLAYLDYVIEKQERLLADFYAKNEISMQNTAYVSLLKKIALSVAKDLPFSPDYKELYKKYLSAKNYAALSRFAKELAKTKNSKFNEHFLLYVSYLGVRENTLEEEEVCKKVRIIKNKSSFVKNRQLASDILKKLSGVFYGHPAPSFEKADTRGKNYSEQNLKRDKPTLMAFFSSDNQMEESMRVVDEIGQRHPKTFHLMVFVCGKGQQKNTARVPTFHLTFYDYLLRDYRLGRFPYFVLIDKDGKVSEQTWQQYFIDLDG